MQKTLLTTLLAIMASLLSAQLVTTAPAAPTEDSPVTITFDASQGTAGLRDCDCDVYLHTGIINSDSEDGGDWQYVQTTWAVEDEAWKLTPVSGEPNKYTYTFSPTIREYFSVPVGTEIQQIALVFRNGDGTKEGKATGGQNIFVDVNAGGAALALNFTGDPGTETYPLGKALPVVAGTTTEATIELYDNGTLLTTVQGMDLRYDVSLITPGDHTIRVIATAGDEVVSREFTITGELTVDILNPTETVVTASTGDVITIEATSYVASELTLTENGTPLADLTATTLSEVVSLPEGTVVTYTVTSIYAGDTASTGVTFITGSPIVDEPPANLSPGATQMDDGSIRLLLRAPGKSDVFVVGNFNDWTPQATSRMKKSTDGETFWLEIPREKAGNGNLLYQYLIDLDKRHADPYSTLVLDPFNDRFIPETVFADIPTYPQGKAEGIVSWLRLDAAEHDWEVDGFTKPDPEKMVVYELLVRDFLADHSYKSLTDTLDYLERLGVNVIELMPVNEFEGNISWGYNPSFHMALDKYYGTPEDLKAFVDACHGRGMAVVLDVVYNHAFGQSPLIRIWSDETGFQPNAQNPYANVEARHPFNVGYDLNHDSKLTQEYVKTTLTYWMEEFRVDGFRFDLSKGFTQRRSTNVPEWNAYDADRIARLKNYADHVWSVDENAYMIMEHLGESREEEELAQYGNGMYFWSGFQPHGAYLQASSGLGQGNISEVLAENRGFSGRNLIAYMESHDEERMMYENRESGAGSGDYQIKDIPTGLDRVELASTFFYTLPGPKMLWQFGELGYDFPINYCENGTINNDCRTGPKPIGWQYRDDENRQDVYNHIADLLYLRNNFDYFHGDLTLALLNTRQKRVHLNSEDGRAAIVGNFSVGSANVTNIFPTTGTWYDYFSGESITVTDVAQVTNLAPGEFHLYLSQPVERGGGRLTTGTNDAAVAELAFEVFPNPTSGELNVNFTLERGSEVIVDLLDARGRTIKNISQARMAAGIQRIRTQVTAPAGLYFVRITEGKRTAVRRVIMN